MISDSQLLSLNLRKIILLRFCSRNHLSLCFLFSLFLLSFLMSLRMSHSMSVFIHGLIWLVYSACNSFIKCVWEQSSIRRLTQTLLVYFSKPINPVWGEKSENFYLLENLLITSWLLKSCSQCGIWGWREKTKYNKHNRNSLASNWLEYIGQTGYERTMKTSFVLGEVEHFRNADYKDWN